jgi:hypothetical protein
MKKLYKIPVGEDAALWRYMSVGKFVSLVVTTTAYFRRLDLLEDQFESVLSPTAHDDRVEDLAAAAVARGVPLPDGVDPYEAAYLAVGSGHLLDRASVFVHCWQRNDHESWAMWKNFGRDGVAVRSTVGRLRDAFNADSPAGPVASVFIGDVEYIDHHTDRMACPFPWLYKNHMFDWEREVRAWIPKTPREWTILGFNADHPHGLPVPINLGVLIERVVVAPGATAQFRANVETLLAQHGLGSAPVEPSAADLIPDYVSIAAHNAQAVRDAGHEVRVHRDDEPDD